MSESRQCSSGGGIVKRPLLHVSLSLMLLGCSAAAWADPGYYVVTAYDNEGQRTIDFRYWSVHAKGGKPVVEVADADGRNPPRITASKAVSARISKRFFFKVLFSPCGT